MKLACSTAVYFRGNFGQRCCNRFVIAFFVHYVQKIIPEAAHLFKYGASRHSCILPLPYSGTPTMTLIRICCAWLLGIVIADQLQLSLAPLLVLAIAASVLAAVWWQFQTRLILVLVAATAFGAARTSAARPVTDETAVWTYVDRTVVLVGKVLQHPDRQDDRQTVVLTSERLEAATSSRAVHGLVRLQLPPVPELRYGQRLRLTGRLLDPPAAGSSSFRAYLARHSIYATMEAPRIEILSSEPQFASLGTLLSLNDHMRAVLLRVLHEPHAGLLAGMLLGTQSAIPSTVLADFRETGTSHLLVISGWNISVVMSMVIGTFRRIGVPPRRAAALALPFLPAYVLFAGASASLLRAGIMGALVVWAALADREADAWTGLLLACALLTLLDPNMLWDLGFQLSALATAGILGWATPLRGWLTRWPPLRSRSASPLVEALAATLAALPTTLPLLLYSFGNLALVAPLANVLLAPAVPLAMLFGTVAAVAGSIALPFGQFLALLAWPFTAWLLWVTHLLARLPGATVYIPPFSAIWLLAWYGLLTGWALWRAREWSSPAPT